ncbi:MAG TPA: tripartite tricarboxylate transporter substrate-binding protein [Burkholderiales bacterium]
MEASSWNGLIVPAGTPKEIIARLHGEVVAVMKVPKRDRLLGAGVEPLVNTPAEFPPTSIAKRRDMQVLRESGARVD